MRVNLDSNALRFGACSHAMRPARELPPRHDKPTAHSAPAQKQKHRLGLKNSRNPEIQLAPYRYRNNINRFDEDERV